MALNVPYSKRAPAGGAYRIALKTGAVAAGVAAAAPLFAIQWTDTQTRMVIQSLNLNVVVTTAYGTAQTLAFSLFAARAFTVADSGGTAITTTQTLDQALDRNMGQSRLFAGNGDMRIATTAAITAGTRTLDDQPMYTWVSGLSATLTQATQNYPIEFGILDATNPMTLRQNDGLVITNDVLLGATGVIVVYLAIEWTEVPNNYT